MPIPTNTTETAQLVEVQVADYARGRVDNTVRRRLVLRMLDQRGRITYNNRSHQFVWTEQFDQPDISTTGAGGQFTFNESDLYRQCGLEVRGYSGEDVLYYKNHAMNGPAGAMIEYYGDKIPRLMEAMEDEIGKDIYLDGNDANRPDSLHGFDSGLGYTAPNPGDMVAQPNDNYAGHATNLGTITGTWDNRLSAANQPNQSLGSDWPNGRGDAAYDWHAPLILNGTSTRWGSPHFYDTAGIIFRRATTWARKNGGRDARPTCFMCGGDKWWDYTTYQEQYFRNVIPHEEAVDLGFPETLKQEGVMIAEEFDTPADSVYILNVNKMELKSIDNVLWRTVGPHYDMKSDAFLFRVGFFGNLIMVIKYQGKIIFP